MRLGSVIKRLIELLALLLIITLICFAMMRLAGSDVIIQKMALSGVALAPEVVAQAREQLGLDAPFFIQYWRWLSGVLVGDMGVSYISMRPVLDTFLEKLPATLLLAAMSLGLSVTVAMPLGLLSAVYHNRWIDHAVRCLSFLGNSLPNFFVALLLMYFLAIKAGWLPVLSNEVTPTSALLPTLTLSCAIIAKYIRQVRATVLDELAKEYVQVARSRGIPFRKILLHNVIPVVCVPILTIVSLSFASLLGGTAIVESIFLWDGIGKLAVDSIRMRDYPMVQAYVMWMAVLYVTINTFTDLAYQYFEGHRRTCLQGVP